MLVIASVLILFCLSIDLPEQSDHELIDQTLAGSTSAFDEIVRRYQVRLVRSLEHSLGSREDALEAAQQAFVSAWKSLSGFRRDSAFYSWLYRIAVNAARTSRRRQRIEASSLNRIQEGGQTVEDHNPTVAPEHALATEERIRLVQQALQEIAEEFRRPLILREMDGLPYDEIATILEIPVGTVRSRIFRARQEVSDRLTRIFGNGSQSTGQDAD
jgi:RNA polymerase sigma-70 factor, ECF subfamily